MTFSWWMIPMGLVVFCSACKASYHHGYAAGIRWTQQNRARFAAPPKRSTAK